MKLTIQKIKTPKLTRIFDKIKGADAKFTHFKIKIHKINAKIPKLALIFWILNFLE